MVDTIEISEKTAECVTRHMQAFLDQSSERVKADFGKPCAECSYRKECKYKRREERKDIVNCVVYFTGSNDFDGFKMENLSMGITLLY